MIKTSSNIKVSQPKPMLMREETVGELLVRKQQIVVPKQVQQVVIPRVVVPKQLQQVVIPRVDVPKQLQQVVIPRVTDIESTKLLLTEFTNTTIKLCSISKQSIICTNINFPQFLNTLLTKLFSMNIQNNQTIFIRYTTNKIIISTKFTYKQLATHIIRLGLQTNIVRKFDFNFDNNKITILYIDDKTNEIELLFNKYDKIIQQSIQVFKNKLDVTKIVSKSSDKIGEPVKIEEPDMNKELAILREKIRQINKYGSININIKGYTQLKLSQTIKTYKLLSMLIKIMFQNINNENIAQRCITIITLLDKKKNVTCLMEKFVLKIRLIKMIRENKIPNIELIKIKYMVGDKSKDFCFYVPTQNLKIILELYHEMFINVLSKLTNDTNNEANINNLINTYINNLIDKESKLDNQIKSQKSTRNINEMLVDVQLTEPTVIDSGKIKFTPIPDIKGTNKDVINKLYDDLSIVSNTKFSSTVTIEDISNMEI